MNINQIKTKKFFKKKQDELHIQDAREARLQTDVMLQSNLRIVLYETLVAIQWAALQGSSQVLINSIWYANYVATWKDSDMFNRDLVFPMDAYESKLKELGFTLSSDCNPLVIKW